MAILSRLPGRGLAVLAALAALVPAACGDVVAPAAFTAERVAVHGVVRAGSSGVQVLVSRIPVPEPGEPIRFVGIEDAVVEVTVAGGPAASLAQVADATACLVGVAGTMAGGFDGSGCYVAALDAPIAAGERVELLVRLPDGASVTGTATVPPPVAIQSPARGARIVSAVGNGFVRGEPYLELAWTAAPVVARLEVTAFATVDGCGVGIGDVRPEVNFVHIRDVAGGEARIPYGYVGCHERAQWDSFPALVRVTAYDSVYARYFDDVLTASAVRIDRASAGLEGALGFFIGTATVNRAITFLAP